MSEMQSRVITERWDITYRHDTGPVVDEFYNRLARDEIVGRRCPQCQRVLVPPRSFCDRDYVETDRWVTVGNSGTVETFTVVFQKFRALPDPVYCIAYVRLEGADTSILNFLRVPGLSSRQEVESRVQVGQRVRVVFAPKPDRRDRITDFWFEPER